jgi:hypothetical protein
MRDRQKQRDIKKKEQSLSTRNEYGAKDMTPYQAVSKIVNRRCDDGK